VNSKEFSLRNFLIECFYLLGVSSLFVSVVVVLWLYVLLVQSALYPLHGSVSPL
jgi:hypothetical protein